MPVVPSSANYQIGGMSVILGGIDLGNIVTAEVNAQDVTVIQHFTARSGERKLDDQRAVQKRLFFRFSLDEHQTNLYKSYFMGSHSPAGTDKVLLMTSPLAQHNILVTYRNATAVIWTYSHTKAQSRPSAAMGFGEFNAYVRFDLEVEILEDTLHLVDGAVAAFGVIDFVANP